MLINNKPASVGVQPLAGSGAGAFMHGITLTGACAGHVAAVVLPRPRPDAANAVATNAIAGAQQAAFRTQSEQYLTLIAPASPGEVGPHPVREPEPV